MNEYELAKIYQILEANRDNGKYATHEMAWMQVGNKYHVFPTIIYDGRELKKYDPRTAYKYSRKKNDYIEFNTPEEADWFSKQYKAIWK